MNRSRAGRLIASGVFALLVALAGNAVLPEPVTGAIISDRAMTGAPRPTIASVTPSAGPTAGGTVVTIVGTEYTIVTAVTFGGTAAASYTVDSATQITATTPARAPGAAQVRVTASGGTSTNNPNFTYVAAPTVSNVSPTSGPAAGGTAVTITGTSFTTATAVTFGGTAAASYTVTNAARIAATTPAHAAGVAQVTVTTAGGTSTSAVSFTFVAAPTVSSASPSAGPIAGGTAVTITGTALTGATAVAFGGTAAASFAVSSATQIIATTPARAAGSAQVVVTTAGGTSTDNVYFTFAAAPAVSAVSPTGGPVAGGTSVAITGTGFSGATAVTFGGTAAAAFTVDGTTRISATTPAHAAGAAQVTVTTPGGTSADAVTFTFISAPTVSSVSPTSGATFGGAVVTITGTHFTAPLASVTFGGTAAASFTVDSTTQITATTPPHAAGATQVVVTDDGGPSADNVTFTFVIPPTVSAVSPMSGMTAGGTAVTITGTDLTGATAVQFDGTAAASFTVDSATQIRTTTPARAAGPAQVTVTTGGGSSTNNVYFTFVAPAPTVASVSPSRGLAVGGTTVTIAGTGFSGATAVKFGTAAAAFTVTSATQITATTPAHAAGAVQVTVTGPNGTNAEAVSFTFAGPPTVTGIGPSAGPTAGGTVVTITGTYLSGATSVRFGDTAAASFTVVSDTQISAVTPPHPAGATAMTATTPLGTSASGTTFTFAEAPTVSALSPARGPASGGTIVAISGTGFAAGAAVRFGDIAAVSVVVQSATRIVATVPAQAAGEAQVIVTTAGGTSADLVLFTYVAEPIERGGAEPIGVGGQTGPSAVVVVLPSTPSPSLVIDVTQSVQLPSSGLVTAKTTIRSIGGGASITLPYGARVTTLDGAPFSGRIDPPQAIVDPTGGQLVVAFEISTSAPVRFSEPLVIGFELPDPAGDADAYQPILVEDGRLRYLRGTAIPGAVEVLTDHLSVHSVYGLVNVPRIIADPSGAPRVTVEGAHSTWAGQSAYDTLAPGRRVDLAVLLRNSGTLTWRHGATGTQVVLGAAAPLDTTRYLDAGLVCHALYNGNRLATTLEPAVAPGEIGTFWLRVRAPLTSGTYQIFLRPVIEGVSWLEDEGLYLQVAVR